MDEKGLGITQDYIQAKCLEERIPHCSLSITLSEEHEPINYGDLSRVYRIGSLSKNFGAYLVHRMVQDGHVKYEDTISPHLELKDHDMT